MSNIKKNISELKQQRRAEALRLNLKKRKQQQHARIALSIEEEFQVLGDHLQATLEISLINPFSIDPLRKE